jgi:hypothetical protein
VGARHVLVTNGLAHFCGEITADREFHLLPDIPRYEEDPAAR